MPTDDVTIVEPDSRWPRRFEEERARLETAIAPEERLAIEHFGSTAVPGLAAKPIIDILLAVPDLDAARAAFPGRLAPLGYVFWADNPKRDRLFFVKGMPPHGRGRTHHVHVCERPGEMWDRLAFRDWLRSHPTDARLYEQLKRDAATRFPTDREAYTAAKDEFIGSIMARAAPRRR
ncbi:MAG: GrpB family protein [Parasphingopyxis sp.]|nr:GrpB family protein [Sphingomonadales bacterium]